METNEQIIKRVSQIYQWLDNTIETSNPAETCHACGKCCDFDTYDHHLFVTTPEVIYLTEKLKPDNIEQAPKDQCPHNIKGKCTVYNHRFASCRIFYCKGDTDFQSKLSESALQKLKSLCEELQIPYCYTDLPTALNNLPTV